MLFSPPQASHPKLLYVSCVYISRVNSCRLTAVLVCMCVCVYGCVCVWHYSSIDRLFILLNTLNRSPSGIPFL